MLTLTVEIVLILLLVVVLVKLVKKKPAPPPPALPQPDLANLKPADAKVGDVVSVSGAGDEFSDLDFTIDRATWHQAGSRRWLELSGLYRDRRVFMRVAADLNSDTQVAINADTKRVMIEDLGVTENDLADMDERQNTGDWFEFEGRTFLYRLSREVQATGPVAPATFYYWEFQERDGDRLLAIKKAEGEPFAATMYKAVPTGNVTVYRNTPV
jgi:hypothetical protein